MSVSVIIVSYNTCELTISCIQSVISQSKDIEYEIIVVDNNSNDGTIDQLSKSFPQVNIISNKINVGFGVASNQGANVARSKYLFFLNSDALLLNNALLHFYNYAEAQTEEFGAIGCYLLNRQQQVVHTYGGFPYPYRYLGQRYRKVFRKLIPVRQIRTNKHTIPSDKNIKVDFVTGADLFIRKEIFSIYGQFDESYFMYFEEADLQWRMYLSKLRREIITGPAIFHEEGNSSKQSNIKRILFESSARVYFTKNFGERTGKIFSFLFSVSIILETLTDLIFREYSVSENIFFLKEYSKRNPQ